MLKITVNNQSLSLSEEVIAENSAEFAAFSVSFSSEWDGYEKTVRFRHADSKTVYDAAGVTDGGEYFIPAEVLHRGRVYVTCIGVKGSHSIATSTRESFEVKGALISGEGTVPTVTPNAYAQYVEMVKNRSQEVNDAADRAQQYANEAEDARVNTLMNSAAAAKSASVAKNAQNRAEDFASAAALSEVSAELNHEGIETAPLRHTERKRKGALNHANPSSEHDRDHPRRQSGPVRQPVRGSGRAAWQSA